MMRTVKIATAITYLSIGMSYYGDFCICFDWSYIPEKELKSSSFIQLNLKMLVLKRFSCFDESKGNIQNHKTLRSAREDTFIFQRTEGFYDCHNKTQMHQL